MCFRKYLSLPFFIICLNSGVCAKQQRKIANAIKRARNFGGHE